MRRIVVVGAGLAGLSAARLLAERHDVVIVDKGRRVGGRLATRRIGDATLDHGAQFLTTHTAEFAETVRGWAADGLVVPWFNGQVGPQGLTTTDGHTRFRGAPTMNAIAQHLADGLDVRTGTTVRNVRRDGDGWVVTLTDDRQLTADALLLTPPVAQSLALLAAGVVTLSTADLAALRAIEYDPCIAVLAVLDAGTALPEPGAVRPDDGAIEWMADNRRKGVSSVDAVTIHTTPTFSREHWHAAEATVVALVLEAAGLTTPSSPAVSEVQVHRWMFAKPTRLHPAPFLMAEGVPPLVFAGDAFDGAKVEGAVLSGRRAGEALRHALGD
jgi:renalase